MKYLCFGLLMYFAACRRGAPSLQCVTTTPRTWVVVSTNGSSCLSILNDHSCLVAFMQVMLAGLWAQSLADPVSSMSRDVL